MSTFCGHSHCRECLKHHWDAEDGLGVYSCPQCERTFPQKPVLEKNTMLAALFKTLKKTKLPDAPPDHYVACDVCIGRKLKALKSCLVCRASYCDSHLQPHRQSPAFLRHKLVEPSTKLQKICPHHDEVMKIFCHSDQQRVCFLCPLDEHMNHDIKVVEMEKRKELEEIKQKIPKKVHISFLTTACVPLSQVLSLPEWECIWTTVQVFCHFTASPSLWNSSTGFRLPSISRDMLGFRFTQVLLLS